MADTVEEVFDTTMRRKTVRTSYKIQEVSVKAYFILFLTKFTAKSD